MGRDRQMGAAQRQEDVARDRRHLDIRDLNRWHAEWSAPLTENGKPRLAAARMAMIVLKTALTFAAG